MPEFVRALAASEVAPGQCVEVSVGGKAVALFNVEGTFYATREHAASTAAAPSARAC